MIQQVLDSLNKSRPRKERNPVSLDYQQIESTLFHKGIELKSGKFKQKNIGLKIRIKHDKSFQIGNRFEIRKVIINRQAFL